MERSTYWMQWVLTAPDAAAAERTARRSAGHHHRPSVRLTPSSETLTVTGRTAAPGLVTEIPTMLVPLGSAPTGLICVTLCGSGPGRRYRRRQLSRSLRLTGRAQPARDRCEDPLSGLATLPYLRTRLAEVYREAEQGGTSPADTHRLLVVRLPRRPDPWHRMALAIGVGRDLRAAFPGGETLSMAGPPASHGTGPAIALVPARGDLPFRYARLRRSVQATFGTQIRVTPLPGRLTEALRLVDELAR